MNENNDYELEFKLPTELFDDDITKIKEFTEKSMKKIVSLSNYTLLKVAMKTHGNTIGTHKVKSEVNLTLSEGNKIIHIEKEIISGTSDEIKNDKISMKWNIPLLVQEALITLEKKVLLEKNK